MMVAVIRKWLIEVIKQAIRADREEQSHARVNYVNLIKEPEPWPIDVAIKVANTPIRAVPRYPDEVPVYSFEQLQEQSLKEQDSYWEKQKPSDV